jgi:hypothetical protein
MRRRGTEGRDTSFSSQRLFDWCSSLFAKVGKGLSRQGLFAKCQPHLHELLRNRPATRVVPETANLAVFVVAEQVTTRPPVRSTLFKQRTGRLVVRWVTTSEYPLLYSFCTFLEAALFFFFWLTMLRACCRGRPRGWCSER